MQAPILVSAPAVAPVSLAEAKAHCRVEADVTDDDNLIASYIGAAVSHFDGYSGILGRCMVNQGWSVALAGWPAGRRLALPFPDVSAVTVTYRDAVEAEQTLSAGSFEILRVAGGSALRFKTDADLPVLTSADRSDRVIVKLTAGYGETADDVPRALSVAILMLVGHWYENREAVVIGNGLSVDDMPLGVQSLTRPFRVVGL